ncbi:hypothetical protein F5B22DRAFT_116302 [Xylaria bambusicola]|uniref:uncharacterized protein n=1 Tax=Xylaria bambusicola TaxID=326684 RepID=UPI0020077D52|nr:uncharacterized protein F5B22DRAFT_116302 [Xylaria bambusicola]KAI0517297.1 hypothetical protein F5B22DRAFT_116302 [Xylaria bambusicola]
MMSTLRFRILVFMLCVALVCVLDNPCLALERVKYSKLGQTRSLKQSLIFSYIHSLDLLKSTPKVTQVDLRWTIAVHYSPRPPRLAAHAHYIGRTSTPFELK